MKTQKVTKVTLFNKKGLFLEGLEAGMNVSEAAKEADISRKTLYAWRKEDTQFASDWKDAQELGEETITEQLQAEVIKRGLEKSDTLLIFELKARLREKYGDAKSRIEAQDRLPLTDAELAARIVHFITPEASDDIE